MVMEFHINDTKTPTTLEIVKDNKVVLNKSFKSLKLLLRWLHHNTKSSATKKMVVELVSMKQWIIGNRFKTKKRINNE